ncbi:hypothetical protein FSP39_012830 [Pinctada imbricata]|uniref:OTU domain-containing protein n=1 Tax=Pinctada imbricata TaxID=66713 RepID=A0AA88YJS5_PINIB|nr:hypothetical protein FSP39_012830 [Pinctada imbricata]
MFRAVHDQLRINGIFHRTPKSIRMDAVRYLREHPNQDDGDHLKSFLGDEKSWEDYLERMSHVGEWGDHMMLKAIVDMLGRRLIVINVKPNDELRKTDLDPHDKTSPGYEEKPLYLGHISESHYLSLRPVGWELEWPKVALAERVKERRSEIRQLDMLAEEVETLRSSQSDPSEENKYLEETKDHIPASCDPIPSDMSLGNQIAETTDAPKDEGSKLEQRVMKEQISEDLLYIQTEDMDTWMKTDRAYIDSISKQPMPHLSLLLENILQMSYFTTFLPYKPRGIVSEYIGSASDGSDRALYNYSDCPEMSAYQQSLQKSPIPITFFPNNIKFPSCGQLERNDVCVVTENVHPGYCRLRPADKTLSCWKDIIYEDSNGICFIKDTKTSSLTDQSQGYRTTQANVQKGFKCLEWPATATEWLTRKRPHKWPSETQVKTMKENGYCILKGSHTSQSDIESQLEWRFVFSHAEKYLFEKCLSLAQMHGYCIFKSLLDYQLRLCDYKLKTIHIKSIFFFACEEISEAMWQDSVGSCVMFMTSKLLCGLQSKFIPNYFIKENNMVDHYDPGALTDILIRIEPIRIFPVETLTFLAERYGISEPAMTNKVMQDAKVYMTDNDLNRSIVQTFIPAKLGFARRLIGSFYYERAHKCICRAYEMHMTSPPSPDGTPPFVPERITFFRNFLRSIYDISCKLTFTFYLVSLSPEFESITGRDRDTQEETKYIRDIIGKEALLGAENLPIPADYANNLFQEAKLLGGLAIYFHRLINYRESEICLTWAIKHMKTVMKEEYIDVSEITDSDLKSTIGLQNVDNFRKWNSELHLCYKNLKILYTSMDNIEKMRYHMDDIEDLHERAPELSMTFFVEDLWHKLREPKRAKAVRARSAVPQLESSYDSINDVD